MIWYIIKYEWLFFAKNKFQMALFTLTFLLGLYSIFYGWNEIKKQKEAIAGVQEEYSRHKKRINEGFDADTTHPQGKKQWQLAAVASYVWHRNTHPACLHPGTLSPLCLGQRDLQRYAYKLSAMSLYYQVFQNEIANPQTLLAGNFDLSFVIIYLFPLLIIAFTYGILSSEKDSGTFPLLKSQAIVIRNLLLARLFFCFILLTSLPISLSMVGFLVCDAGLDEDLSTMAAWLTMVCAYSLFWFSTVYFLITFHLSSDFNAIAGSAAWILFLIVVPALINIAMSISMPFNSTALSGISRRSGVFDEEKEENHKKVIQEFLLFNPQYHAGSQLYRTNLMAKGHAAFTALRDNRSQALVNQYRHQVNARNAVVKKLTVMNPAVSVQEVLGEIAETDLPTFQHFNAAVESYHKKLVGFYYSRLFKDEHFDKESMAKVPSFVFVKMKKKSSAIEVLAVSLLLSAALFVLGNYNLKRTA